MSKFKGNPLHAERGTLTQADAGRHATLLFGRFTELPIDPEVEEEEQRVSRGKLRHRREPSHFFVPAPLARPYDRYVARMPKRARYELMPGGTTPDPDEIACESCGGAVPLPDDGLELSERIAELLERRPDMVYTVYTQATRDRRETIIYALIAAARLLEPETKVRVARQVRHFSGPLIGEVTAAFAS